MIVSENPATRYSRTPDVRLLTAEKMFPVRERNRIAFTETHL